MPDSTIRSLNAGLCNPTTGTIIPVEACRCMQMSCPTVDTIDPTRRYYNKIFRSVRLSASHTPHTHTLRVALSTRPLGNRLRPATMAYSSHGSLWPLLHCERPKCMMAFLQCYHSLHLTAIFAGGDIEFLLCSLAGPGVCMSEGRNLADPVP